MPGLGSSFWTKASLRGVELDLECFMFYVGTRYGLSTDYHEVNADLIHESRP